MKTIKYTAAFATAIFILSSCAKKLDVLPQNNITPGQITTGEDVKAVLFGAYKLLQSGSAFGEQFILTADLLASNDQVDFIGTFTTYRDLQNKTQLEDNGVALTIWTNAYTVINTVNTVIDKISLVDESERDAIEGEAKFIRGIVYFQLVNFYGLPYSKGNTSANPGVPLILQPVYNYDESKDKPARSSVEEVYTQVLSDLNDAAASLPESADNFRATKFAAQAFLSRVYMQMGNYSEAAAQANAVISLGAFSLNSSFTSAFNNTSNSPEDVFAIQQSSQSNAGTTNAGLTTFYAAQPAGRGDAQINPGYLSYFESDDARGTFYYDGVSIGGFSGIYTGKWSDFYKAIPVVRLAEMYLTRGEANLRAGTSTGAMPTDDINTVRLRAGASAIEDATAQDFVDERFRELGFEGDRLWTLKRLQLVIDDLPYDADILVLPIPRREIDANGNLTQNPGY